jgi:hypothetical protein
MVLAPVLVVFLWVILLRKIVRFMIKAVGLERLLGIPVAVGVHFGLEVFSRLSQQMLVQSALKYLSCQQHHSIRGRNLSVIC